jgi:hypothetical protein
MLELQVVLGDVLSSASSALVIPIDGTFVPRQGQFERLLGNIGRQFIRRFPEADLLEEIEAQVDFPLPLGSAAAVALTEGTFRHVILVSTLHHVDQLDHRAKRALVGSSLQAAVDSAARAGASTLATAVLQGGWRLQPADAFAAMLGVAAGCSGPETHVYVLDRELHDRLHALACSVGFSAHR